MCKGALVGFIIFSIFFGKGFLVHHQEKMDRILDYKIEELSSRLEDCKKNLIADIGATPN